MEDLPKKPPNSAYMIFLSERRASVVEDGKGVIDVRKLMLSDSGDNIAFCVLHVLLVTLHPSGGQETDSSECCVYFGQGHTFDPPIDPNQNVYYFIRSPQVWKEMSEDEKNGFKTKHQVP